MSEIKGCVCESKFQDQRYGKGQRVHNPLKSTKTGDKWRCTVCGRGR